MYSYCKYALITDTALSGSSYITDFNYNIPLMVSITSSFEKILQLVRRRVHDSQCGRHNYDHILSGKL